MNILNRRTAFTLIELLIVVAIIAILAAIAVPNFLEAQTRAKVARSKADLRTIAVAVESYAVDWNRPPLGVRTMTSGAKFGTKCVSGAKQPYGLPLIFAKFTTPVAYIATVPDDVFQERGTFNIGSSPSANQGARLYQYQDLLCQVITGTEFVQARSNGYTWVCYGYGPERRQNNDIFVTLIGATHSNPEFTTVVYDPTNGTVSRGMIIRTNKGDFRQPGG